MEILKSELQRLCPRPQGKKGSTWDGYVNAITSPEGAALLKKYDVTSNLRWCHLIATWAHETGGFTIVWEDMYYSADRILQVFRDKEIYTLAEARKYAGNPYALAERVYGVGYPRMAAMLGNRLPGDGYNFRGCGITQLTGRYAHEKAATIIGCPLNALSDPLNSMHGALIEWDEKKANRLADKDDANAVRRAINGGHNGLADFRNYLAKAKRIWPVTEKRDNAIVALGDVGEQVKALQTMLAAAGYSPGATDGIFGTLTERAVAAYQVTNGVTGTGRVDAETWAMIEASSRAHAKAITAERASITVQDLKEKGSETATNAAKVETAGKVTTGLVGLTITDAVFGIGAVDSTFDQIEKVNELAQRSSSILGIITSPRVIFCAIILAGGVFLWKWGSKIQWRRLLDAQSGANLGR